MRTTVDLEDDVVAAIEHLRRERRIGLSAAINEVIRRGLVSSSTRETFHQEVHPLGITIDVTNIADALEVLEGPTAR